MSESSMKYYGYDMSYCCVCNRKVDEPLGSMCNDGIKNCYLKCSDYHLLGEATHWDYIDFIIDDRDTIWIDEECYNDWCICIDECKAGLCCEFLR